MKPRQLLQINTSLFSSAGQSSRLAQTFIETWQRHYPQDRITVRDLGNDPVPHLDGARFAAFLAQPQERSPAQQAIVDESQTLIDELSAADVVVLGLPMYNFGIPSQLKAYFDHIARAGITFRYTANGSEGLLANKKVYVLAARGGLYQGTARDSQTRYVVDFLNFIGLTDIEFVYAEGLNINAESKQTALEAARDRIEILAA